MEINIHRLFGIDCQFACFHVGLSCWVFHFDPIGKRKWALNVQHEMGLVAARLLIGHLMWSSSQLGLSIWIDGNILNQQLKNACRQTKPSVCIQSIPKNETQTQTKKKIIRNKKNKRGRYTPTHLHTRRAGQPKHPMDYWLNLNVLSCNCDVTLIRLQLNLMLTASKDSQRHVNRLQRYGDI